MAAKRWLALVVVLALTAMAAAGPEWVEQGDAGETPAGSQDTTGVGPVGRISGKLDGLASQSIAGGPDFQDVFKIYIENPTQFQITTEYGLGDTEFEARIYLFTIDGQGLLGAVMGGDGTVAILNASNDGTNIVIDAPGLYLLAVTVTPFGPQCADGTVFTFTFDGEVSGPDGTAQENCVYVDWTTQPVEYGACCFLGEPCMLISADACEDLDGEYLGDGSACDDCPASGACCFGELCEILTEDDCSGKGSYLGDGTTCDPNPCIPLGACCLDDGMCLELTAEDDCDGAGGLYQGDGTTCKGVSGCTGACLAFPATAGDTVCLDDVSEYDCLFFYYGSYAGNGTVCDQGACCFDDDVCVQTTELDCDTGGGTYDGDATACPEDGCSGRCFFGSKLEQCEETTRAMCINVLSGKFGGYFTFCPSKGGVAGVAGLPTIGVAYKIALQGVSFSSTPPGIPTLSEWALIIMGLLLLGAITVLIRRV